MQLKILSDRRGDGGGIAYLVKFSPPAGKLIKLVAVARSDEHVYILAGGYCNKAGEQLRWPGDYGLNPNGHPHSAFIGEETVNLAVYTGEPDEVLECTVIDPEPPLLGTDPRTYTRIQDIGTLYHGISQDCHSERSEESHCKTLHSVQGGDPGVPIS